MALFNAGMISLVAGYMLSQFYRAFLAVMAPLLMTELGVSAGDLAWSSGLWFLAFAAPQVAIGWGLDRFGPRRTVGWLLAIGGAGGAALFAMAQGPVAIHAAMTLIGLGCGPVLMGTYYIFARNHPPAAFATLAGIALGLGNLGNILSSVPLVWLVDALGWRATLWLLAVLTLAIAVAILTLVRDPASLPAPAGGSGSLADIIRIRALWPVLPLLFCGYATVAAFRGLWAGPYLDQVFGASPATVGWATLLMSITITICSFLTGPLTHALRSPRRAILVLNGGTLTTLALLLAFPDNSLALAMVLLTCCALFGSSYALFMAHGRALLPPHLVGRGVTFLNTFSIGGAGVLQFSSRGVFEAAAANAPPVTAYTTLFAFFFVPTAIGWLIFATLTSEHDNV